jgi:hypothetical protein
MALSRDWVAWFLLAVAIGCVAAATFPQWSEWVDPASGDRVSEQRFGLWFSPLYDYTWRELPRAGFHVRAKLNWLSWSSLLLAAGLLAGVGSFEAFRRRRRAVGEVIASPPQS